MAWKLQYWWKVGTLERKDSLGGPGWKDGGHEAGIGAHNLPEALNGTA